MLEKSSRLNPRFAARSAAKPGADTPVGAEAVVRKWCQGLTFAWAKVNPWHRYARQAQRLALPFFLSFVTGANASALVKNPETFVYAISGDIDSLDPHWQYDGVSQMVSHQIYETLVSYHGSSIKEFEPMIASMVPSQANSLLSADGLRYTFPIRKGVLFHDGTPLTPQDVKYSLLRFLLMDRSAGASFLLLGPILDVRSTRDSGGLPVEELFDLADRAVRVEGGAVVVELRRPYPALLHVLASYCPIVSKSWTASRGGWDGTGKTWRKFNDPRKQDSPLYEQANGTGPFLLERWDKQQRQLTLSRHERYWRTPAKLKHLVIKTVDEFSARKLMLKAGDADAAFVERQFAAQVENLPGVVAEDFLPFFEVHNAFVFNFDINPVGNTDIGSGKLDGAGIPPNFFTDIHLRRAFAHAFDYNAYVSAGYRGKALRARGPIPYGLDVYNGRQAVPEYSPAKAAELFRKAWEGQVWEKGFKFTVSYMKGRADRQLACVMLKHSVESINPRFSIDVRPVEWSSHLSAAVSRKLPMVNARWGLDIPDAHNSAYAFLHSEGYYPKSSGYVNPRADRLVESAANELDPDRRRLLYFELQALAAMDLPAFFTVDTYHLRVRRGWVKGWDYNPMMMYGYFYPVSKEEP